MVFVKLRPYYQTHIFNDKFNKLRKQYYGPFTMSARVGTIAYKLELPSYSKIHNVFHCVVLKPYYVPSPTNIDHLPSDLIDNHLITSHLSILDSKTECVAGVAPQGVLDHCIGLSLNNTYWGDLKVSYNLKDKVYFDGEGILQYFHRGMCLFLFFILHLLHSLFSFNYFTICFYF